MEYLPLLYLVTIINQLKDYLTGLGVIVSIMFVALSFAAFIYHITSEDYSDESQRGIYCKGMSNSFKKWAVAMFVLACFIHLFNAVVPDKKSSIFLVAYVGVAEVVKSQAVQSVSSKALGVVEAWLDEQKEFLDSSKEESKKERSNKK